MNRPYEDTLLNKKRIAAGLLAFAMLFFVLLSVSFMVHEAEHDCTGDDCPVCALIQMCEDSLRQLGTGIAAASAALTAVTAFVPMLSLRGSDCLILSTPVSRKTRLNN